VRLALEDHSRPLPVSCRRRASWTAGASRPLSAANELARRVKSATAVQNSRAALHEHGLSGFGNEYRTGARHVTAEPAQDGQRCLVSETRGQRRIPQSNKAPLAADSGMLKSAGKPAWLRRSAEERCEMLEHLFGLFLG
jgi:hypothetical protein